jgi:hypothetical protein
MPAAMNTDEEEGRDFHASNSKQPSTRTIDPQQLVSQIQSKLAQGAEVTKEDLQGLHQILLLQNNTETTATLNRTFLDRWNHVPELSSYRLVRHFGMVQDMMDPEYYIADVQGQSMHFRDPSSTSLEDAPDDGELLAQHLAERQPLLVVPVPFASEWFASRMTPPETDEDMPASSVVIPESPPSQQQQQQQQADGSRKRERGEEASSLAAPSAKTKTKTTSDGTPPPRMECEEPASTPASEAGRVHGQESDWWPAGSLESPVNECPVLAKLYYDQYPQSKEKLRLNDLVETIGIVSMDPWEADFSNNVEDFGILSPPLPPPSRLPRLHVLSFRRVDLDTVVAATQQESSSNLQHCHEEQPSLTQELSLSRSLCKDPLEAWTNHCCLSLDSTTLAETLFLTLVAKAERKRHGEVHGDIQRGPQHALGSASVQLVCPNDRAADLLYRKLHQFLHQLCPVVAGIDFTSSNDLPPGIVSVPSKESGRIWLNPWQLPPGSTLLIRAPNAWNHHPTIRPIVEELCAQHRLAYKFEGGMKVPFDADYRIIVVSSSSQQDPLTCTLQLTLNDLVTEDAETTSLFPTNPQTLQELRQALAQGRSQSQSSSTTTNVGLPPSVLEQAQQDFLQRRGHARSSAQSSTTPTTAMPEEADFHRWLTLTRLYARARSSSMATAADWESALELDDTIRCSYS